MYKTKYIRQPEGICTESEYWEMLLEIDHKSKQEEEDEKFCGGISPEFSLPHELHFEHQANRMANMVVVKEVALRSSQIGAEGI